jgi:polyketide biosynthesis acyl carrier protein
MNNDDVFSKIVEHTREVLPELQDHVFQRSDQLVNLGANSIDRAEIVGMTMESFALSIPRVELFGVKNIGELSDVIHAKLLKK